MNGPAPVAEGFEDFTMVHSYDNQEGSLDDEMRCLHPGAHDSSGMVEHW